MKKSDNKLLEEIKTIGPLWVTFFVGLIILIAFVWVYGEYRSRSIGFSSVYHIVAAEYPERVETQTFLSFGENQTSIEINLEYYAWTKGNGAELIIKDSTSGSLPLFEITVTDDEQSFKNAYLIKANLDEDNDLEFFIYQPNVPRAIMREGATSPGIFILDYANQEFNLITINKFKAFWLTGFARNEFQFYIFIVFLICLRLRYKRLKNNIISSRLKNT